MKNKYILPVKPRKVLQNIGSKTKNIYFLLNRNYAVPKTYVCTWDAFLQFHQKNHQILNLIKNELNSIVISTNKYAVRSSANIEDELEHSFAGQFKTVLNISGIDNIINAIKIIWESASTPNIESYLIKIHKMKQELKMAVIIQEMVMPVISGVSFSKNPITGMDEVIVEAVQGSGDRLVQEGITPDRWVNKWGDWQIKPEKSDIPDLIIEKVVNQTKEIAKDFGKPVDLEWVYDGKKIQWIQLREITTLKGINIYSNRISREFLPGMIKPLVWSINIPLVNTAWIRFFTELIGKNNIKPQELAKSFHYRVYFNMGVIGQIFEILGMPRETLEVMMGIESTGKERPKFRPTTKTYTHLQRMVKFALDKLNFSRRIDSMLPKMRSVYKKFSTAQLSVMNEKEILKAIDELFEFNLQTAYYNIVVPLLMYLYNQLFKYQLTKYEYELENVDLTKDLKLLDEYYPNRFISNLHAQYTKLDSVQRVNIFNGDYHKLSEDERVKDFKEKFDHFLSRFGHFSDSGNDFSSVPWRENPNLVLKMIINYNPLQSTKQVKLNFEQLKLSWLFRPLARFTYNRARKFRLYREQVSSLYTYGYGLFRNYFLALGIKLQHRGLIEDSHDIFYLYLEEIKNSVLNQNEHNLIKLIAQRKKDMAIQENINLPTIIFGDVAPPIFNDHQVSLIGIPTSRGYYQGPVKIIRTTNDFDKLKPGEVLVVPFSDIGWTPLFAKAGAVIAESGGMLSHSSIIAREYGIPAVVSVQNAGQLKDGITVAVDGYTGKVTLIESAKEENNEIL